MGFTFGTQKTLGGYALGECSSALQKEIRRGNEEAAMYWAIEIETVQPKYLMNRLKVIASEDIGLTVPDFPATINALAQNYLECRQRRSTSKVMFLSHIILLMCRAPKSRVVDDFIFVAHKNLTHLEVPDYALDKHTGKGRAMGRGFKHWEEEGTLLVNAVTLEKDEEYRQRASELREAPDKYPAYPTAADYVRFGVPAPRRGIEEAKELS
jgi:replication-associated recombination protein RarA